MARLRIDHSEASDAAKFAGRASESMNEYADSLTNNVSAKVEQLTGGSTANTSNVASLAQQKAKALRDKANNYGKLQKRIETFNSAAAQADKDVAGHINRVKSEDSENLTWYQKLFANIYSMYQETIGQTGLGKALNSVLHGAKSLFDLGITAVQKAYDFFVYGNGKYVLNIIGSVAAAVGSVILFVGAIGTGVGAIAAGVAAVIAVATALATVVDNAKALGMGDDDPGAAAYYGDTDSLSSFFKKHVYDRTTQNVALAADITGKVASMARDGIAAWKGVELNPFSKDFVGKDLNGSAKPTGWAGIGHDLAGKVGFKWNNNNVTWDSSSFFRNVTGFKSGENTPLLDTLSNIAKFNDYLQKPNLLVHNARQATQLHQLTGDDIGKDILKHTPLIKDGYDIVKDSRDLFEGAGKWVTYSGWVNGRAVVA